MKIKILILFGLLLISDKILAQDYSVLQNLSFKEGNEIIKNPYGGALKSVQLSQVDFNNDGTKDLFVFDRSAELVYPFINAGDAGEVNYKHEPSYMQVFPRMFSWAVLRDYNQDGVEDIFCSPTDEGIAGVRVYRGSRVADQLHFEIVKFPDYNKDVMWYSSFGSQFQIYVANTDIPGIVDVDNDGDLDVLSFDTGGAYMSYYQNQSVELGFGLDSLIFIQKDACFGKFLESPFSEELFLSDDNQICFQQYGGDEGEGVTVRHAGSTVNPFDYKNDGLIDLLLGDLAYDGLVFLENGGTSENAWMNQQSVGFPDYDTPVAIDIFNAAFFPDVDLDGHEDLVVSLNQRVSGQNMDNIWYFENVSDDQTQVFNLQNKNFLKDEGLLLGNRVIPKFVDYNLDGLMDLVIATQGFFGSADPVNPHLKLFENIGSQSVPSFELIDDDYLNMSEFSTTSALFSPCFGDLDGDLDIDLIIGDENGYLYYLENIAGPSQTFQFADPIYRFKDIRVGQTVNPYIFDFNEDGLGDIFIGERGKTQDLDGNVGVLNYLVNQGTIGDPHFTRVSNEPNTQVFGLINILKYPAVVSSAPAIYNSGEDCLIFIGTEDGEVHVYEGPKGDPGIEFTELSENLGDLHVGGSSVIDIADIDNDEYLEIAMGGGAGSFFIFNTTIKADGSVAAENQSIIDQISIYPNPVADKLYFSSTEIGIEWMEVYNVTGQKIISAPFESSVNVEYLEKGVYFIELISPDKKKACLKFVKSD
jgi:hypothetical protein